jgi:excisionase family DNA binding protein
MELITFESEAFKEIIRNINEIKSNLNNKGNSNTLLTETWLDIQETCQLLKISKRTLQSYRDNGILPFSQIGGKIYFRAADIEYHLKKHYIKAFNPKK